MLTSGGEAGIALFPYNKVYEQILLLKIPSHTGQEVQAPYGMLLVHVCLISKLYLVRWL